MKKNILALFLTLTLCVLTGYGNDYKYSLLNHWQDSKTYTSLEGRFSLIFPSGLGKLNYEKRTGQADAGAVEIHQYSAVDAGRNATVAYYDLPENLFQIKEITKMLEDGRDKVVGKGKLVKEEKITVDGYQGLSVLFEIPYDTYTFYVRSNYVVAKPRMYNYLFLSTDKSDLDRADVKNFFSSFHIQK